MAQNTNQNLPIGCLLYGKYRIEKILGQGGFGITYMAKHEVLQKKVAIKELFLSTQSAFCSRSELDTRTVKPHFERFDMFKERFLNEARTIAKFTGQPGIVQIAEIFEENGTVYFVMDFVEGVTLGEIIKKQGALSEKEAVNYAIKILETLKIVHKEGILHRDIKPDNLIISNKNKQPVLIDFGIAREYVENEAQTHTAMISPGYAPPEQELPKARRTASMDLYSVGAVLYYCLTGQRPQTVSEIMTSGYVQARDLNPNISAHINSVINKALEKKPENRYQSSEQMINALQNKQEESTQLWTEEKKIENSGQNQAIGQTLLATERNSYLTQLEVDNSTSKVKSSPPLIPFTNVLSRKIVRYSVIALTIVLLSALLIWQLWGRYLKSQQIAKNIQNSDPFENQMINIQGGSFQMGCNEKQNQGNCESDELPVHTVQVNNFSISKYEVTQKQWMQIMKYNPSRFRGCEDCPVEAVSWSEIQDFLNNLNKITGKNYRLPTEAEWEYAARAGQDYTYAGSDNIEQVAWYAGNSSNRPHSVGQKLPNSFGLYDMTGNVYEWCSDWYRADYSPSNLINTLDTGTYRVLRGGGWSDPPQYNRLSNRYYNIPYGRRNDAGFRVAR